MIRLELLKLQCLNRYKNIQHDFKNSYRAVLNHRSLVVKPIRVLIKFDKFACTSFEHVRFKQLSANLFSQFASTYEPAQLLELAYFFNLLVKLNASYKNVWFKRILTKHLNYTLMTDSHWYELHFQPAKQLELGYFMNISCKFELKICKGDPTLLRFLLRVLLDSHDSGISLR